VTPFTRASRSGAGRRTPSSISGETPIPARGRWRRDPSRSLDGGGRPSRSPRGRPGAAAFRGGAPVHGGGGGRRDRSRGDVAGAPLRAAYATERVRAVDRPRSGDRARDAGDPGHETGNRAGAPAVGSARREALTLQQVVAPLGGERGQEKPQAVQGLAELRPDGLVGIAPKKAYADGTIAIAWTWNGGPATGGPRACGGASTATRLLPTQAQSGTTKALLLAVLRGRFPVPCCATCGRCPLRGAAAATNLQPAPSFDTAGLTSPIGARPSTGLGAKSAGLRYA